MHRHQMSQTGELLLRASKLDTTCIYVYVCMYVLRVMTRMCEDLYEITFKKNIAALFLKKVLKNTRA